MVFHQGSRLKEQQMTQSKTCTRNFLCSSFHYSQDSYVLSQFAVVEHSQCSKEFMSPSHKKGEREGEREGEAEGGEAEGGEGKQQQNTSITTQILWGLMIIFVLITNIC